MAIPTPAARARPLELVCPAGNLPSLKTAVDNGADSVYLGFRDDTNARHFPGLHFDAKTVAQGIRYAHAKHWDRVRARYRDQRLQRPDLAFSGGIGGEASGNPG